jgi:hypothetical protein
MDFYLPLLLKVSSVEEDHLMYAGIDHLLLLLLLLFVGMIRMDQMALMGQVELVLLLAK